MKCPSLSIWWHLLFLFHCRALQITVFVLLCYLCKPHSYCFLKICIADKHLSISSSETNNSVFILVSQLGRRFWQWANIMSNIRILFITLFILSVCFPNLDLQYCLCSLWHIQISNRKIKPLLLRKTLDPCGRSVHRQLSLTSSQHLPPQSV